MRKANFWIIVGSVFASLGLLLLGAGAVSTATFERKERWVGSRPDHLWQHPGPDLPAQRVRVLFDPADPVRNLIDVTSLRPSQF
jgi:hypothetical protein